MSKRNSFFRSRSSIFFSRERILDEVDRSKSRRSTGHRLILSRWCCPAVTTRVAKAGHFWEELPTLGRFGHVMVKVGNFIPTIASQAGHFGLTQVFSALLLATLLVAYIVALTIGISWTFHLRACSQLGRLAGSVIKGPAKLTACSSFQSRL